MPDSFLARQSAVFFFFYKSGATDKIGCNLLNFSMVFGLIARGTVETRTCYWGGKFSGQIENRKFRYATVTEPLHCVYKFDYDKYSGTFDIEDDNSPVGEVNRHKFYGKMEAVECKQVILGWHTATLILLALALLTAFMSVCIGICGCCYGSLALVFSAITLLTSKSSF